MQKNALGFKVWGLQQGQKNKGKKRAAVPPGGVAAIGPCMSPSHLETGLLGLRAEWSGGP